MGTHIRSAKTNSRILPNGLSFYLDAGNSRSFDNTSNVWKDLSGYNRNGTLNNSPTFIYNNSSSYFVFDGIDDNMTTSYPITATPALGNWTYEIWTELTSYPTSLGFPNIYGISYRAGTLFGAVNNAGAALYWYGDSTGSSCVMYGVIKGNDAYRSTPGFGMQLNKTYHFSLVNNYSAGTITLFVNGTYFSATSAATQEYNAASVSGLNIGIAQPQVDVGGQANYSYYPGRIKAARIYGIALTEAQLAEHFYAFRQRYGV